MRAPSMWQLIVILVVIVLLFGWKRLPDMARSVGRSMRIFKSEIEQMAGDDTKDEDRDKDKEREQRADSTSERTDDRSTSSTALEGRVTDDPQPDTRPRD